MPIQANIPAEEAADRALALLATGGGQAYYGEVVSQLEHALQSAELARSAHTDEETIAAALLHDIGHLVSSDRCAHQIGVVDHDASGAVFLRELCFPERVMDLVAGHVAAKRYLVAVNAVYAGRLSTASRQTLELQGGPMSTDEVA